MVVPCCAWVLVSCEMRFVLRIGWLLFGCSLLCVVWCLLVVVLRVGCWVFVVGMCALCDWCCPMDVDVWLFVNVVGCWLWVVV